MSLGLTDVSENTFSFSSNVGPNIDQPRKLRLINRSQYHPLANKETEFLRYNQSD